MKWLALLLLSAQVEAGGRPWSLMGADDVRVIADPRLEMSLRLDLVRRAHHTIDIANYDQRADETVALPLATALRDAADRGVRVRFMVSWNTTVLFDYYNRFGELLVDPPTSTPIEYLVVGGPASQDRGWGMLEGVHEKLFIVDGIALMTTGRGIGEEYLWWLDTGFAVRGPLVAQASRAFEAVWSEARRDHRPYAGNLGGPTHQTARVYAAPLLDGDRAGQRDALVAWLAAPSSPSELVRGRVLHHDFLRQVHQLDATPVDVGVAERLARLRDPVVEALIEGLATAHTARISLLSTILHPDLKRALVEASRRGADVRLFLNTCAPRLGKSRSPVVARGSVWAMELPDLDDLLRAGVQVHGFQIRHGVPWLFLHRKLAILDDTVFFGSHNLNIPSTVFFDEVSFEVESPSLAAELARLFDADVKASGERLDPARVRKERLRWKTRMIRWMSAPYLGYM